MGTQQSRSGHGRQGSQQQGQQSDRRPQQDRDLQRNKQSDRGQQHQQGDRSRPQQGSGAAGGQQDQGAERQQSQLGGHKDFTHRMENEGREQNREQQDVQRQQGEEGQQGGQSVYGEGNYAASRQYNEATKEYTQSGGVEQAARAAAPKSDTEARQMKAAEAEGKRHAKGEDPALTRGPSGQSTESTRTPRPGHEEE